MLMMRRAADARRPDEIHHPLVEESNGDEPVLTVVPPIVLDGQSGARTHLAGTGHVESSHFERCVTRRRIELDHHELLLPHSELPRPAERWNSNTRTREDTSLRPPSTEN